MTNEFGPVGLASRNRLRSSVPTDSRHISVFVCDALAEGEGRNLPQARQARPAHYRVACRGHPPADRATGVIRCATRSDVRLRWHSVVTRRVPAGWRAVRLIMTASRAFRFARQTTARSWCAAMRVATRNGSLQFCGLAVCGRRTLTRPTLRSRAAARASPVRDEPSAPKPPLPSGRLRCQPMVRWSRLISPRAACISLQRTLRFHARAEAPLGRHLAGDGGAGHARC